MSKKEIVLTNGAVVYLEGNPLSSSCRSCRKAIWFARTAQGRHMPITKNEKGEWISHFQDCPAAGFHRHGKGHYNPDYQRRKRI